VNKTYVVRRKGFSLIEMVLALALGGSVLLASVSLMTTFVEVWERETRPDWETERQVIAKKFLENSLEESYIRLQGMYFSRVGIQQDAQPYVDDTDLPGTSHLYWQNYNTPPFIHNPQGKFIQYHLEHDAKKHRVHLHYRLLPSNVRAPSPPTEHVLLFRRCTYFGYAYYTFDSDKWDIMIQPIVTRNKPSPNGLYFQFEDKTQLFIYLKKYGSRPFNAPTTAPLPPNKPNPSKSNVSN
jgi:prepilin-type N-terminal cleavage/methylation domain-containing protein